MIEKNSFDIFKEMNIADEANKTHNLVLSPYFLRSQKTNQGGEVTMGVSSESFNDIAFNNEDTKCFLLVINMKEFNKLK